MEGVTCAVQWQVLEFGVNFMEPDYLQFQIKSVILHLHSTLVPPTWQQRFHPIDHVFPRVSRSRYCWFCQ